jgi:hypothetical protein
MERGPRRGPIKQLESSLRSQRKLRHVGPGRGFKQMLGRVRSPGRQTDRDRREFRLHNSQNWTIAGSRHAPELPGTADIIHERAVIATTEIGARLRAVRLTPGVGGCRAPKAAVAILLRSFAVPFASDSFRNEWRIPPRRLEGDHLQISTKEDDPSSVVSISKPMTAIRWRRLSSTEFPPTGLSVNEPHSWLDS